MNIVITGAAGFIGINFVYYMLSKHPEDNIIGYDALTYAANPDATKCAEKNPRFTFIKGDIRDREAVNDLFTTYSPDILINFAAESHVDRSIDNPSLFLETNVLGTGVLLDAARKYGLKRFHQVSTDEVYGDTEIESRRRFREEDPLLPSSPYSASKAAADLLCLSYRRTYGLFVTISRCTNNFGWGQHAEKLIPKTIERSLRKERIPIYGSGENIREWIDAEDHSRAIEWIINNGESGEIYNIGTGLELSNIALVRMILRMTGGSESLIEHTEDRKGHDRRYALDSSKFTRLSGLSFTAEETMKSLERTIELLSCKTSSTSL